VRNALKRLISEPQRGVLEPFPVAKKSNFVGDTTEAGVARENLGLSAPPSADRVLAFVIQNHSHRAGADLGRELVVVLLVMAPSQELEPPINQERFSPFGWAL
jgi:hypothetical protein